MDTESKWKSILNEMELTLSRAEFVTWFSKTRLNFDEGGKTAYIVCPSIFVKEWVKKKYADLLKKEIKKAFPKVNKFEFTLHSPSKREEERAESTSSEPASQRGGEDKKEKIGDFSKASKTINFKPLRGRPSNLNPKYSLDNFIVGSHNELAFAAAKSVIENPGTAYNPLYIYGNVGLGKTHLLQGIGNALFENHKSKVAYLPSELFLSQIVASIRGGSIEELKNNYRNVDVLILDDIQIISGKEKFQEIFFDTFNALYSQGKQIILSSDCLPSDIPALENRLRSRFHGGMIADISMPALETRMAILKLKAEKQNFVIPEETAFFIAENLASNIRQMEGALNRLATQCQLSQKEASLDYAKEVLTIIAKESCSLTKKATPDDLICEVAKYFDISETDIKKHTRKLEISKPRQIAMYLLREKNKMPFPTIGRIFGRDHSTAIHAFKKISKEVKLDTNLEKDINTIQQKLDHKL